MNLLNPKIIAPLFFLGGVCVIMGILFVYHETSEKDKVQISKQTYDKTRRSTMTIPRTTINSNKCPKGRKKKWTVKVEACSKQTATPRDGIIKNWQLANHSLNGNNFELHANGSFEIKKKGLYSISIKVSFIHTQDGNYSIKILHAPSIENSFNTRRSEDNQCVVKSTFCGMINEKVLFFISVPKYFLVSLYPDQTAFTVTKWKQDVPSKRSVMSP